MPVIKDGKYRIQLAPGSHDKVVVGVDGHGDIPRPVVVWGQFNVFSIYLRKGEDQYLIAIEVENESFLYTGASDDDRVVAGSNEPLKYWVITKQESGYYTIIQADSNLGWTLERFNLKDPVILDPVPEPPRDVQLWELIHVPE